MLNPNKLFGLFSVFSSCISFSLFSLVLGETGWCGFLLAHHVLLCCHPLHGTFYLLNQVLFASAPQVRSNLDLGSENPSIVQTPEHPSQGGTGSGRRLPRGCSVITLFPGKEKEGTMFGPKSASSPGAPVCALTL
ncbi:hypothetical protein B0H63DRAFT_457971 [Podospora didyma]|uniref:Uncharacterized protein n=1 Tax=Podospora didyma TaxID=330526 RepID=A0AAE0U700_9PEZI|nr:hypothetical protein B0H63DRAFT_457971 [Podospora didyma]